jgi:hypothetical protein
MGVNLRSGNAFMAEQRLNIHQLYVFFQQARGVSMPELVRRDFLGDAGLVNQLL